MNQKQLDRMQKDHGFIAALDQSGGSTPKALAAYGVAEDSYQDEAGMFDLVHEMRTRIITSPAFDGEKIIGAILFEQTMDRDIDGMKTADYLWEKKGIVPFLKVDKGLDEKRQGVQMMKPMPELDALLDRAKDRHIFGTKMRSLIHEANEEGIRRVVEQQFEVARRIADRGLVPIIEPEVSIKAPDKAEAESILLAEILKIMATWPTDKPVIFKLTLPEQDNFYKPLINMTGVVRVVALSGGYSREDANAKLGRNHALIASFSRALSEGLAKTQSDDDFNRTMEQSVKSIYDASVT